MKKPYYTLVILILFSIPAFGQQNTLSSGGDASGTGGSTSYSVGQVAFTTNTSENGSVNHGVQQPYIIQAITGIDEPGISLSLTAYPNPTTDILQLVVESEMKKHIRYQLYSMQGQLLANEDLTLNQTGIDLSGYMPATYILKVIRNNSEVKSFKIIKN